MSQEKQNKETVLTLCLVQLELELTLKFRLLIELLQQKLVLLQETGGVFCALRELFLQRKVDIMSLLQLKKK